MALVHTPAPEIGASFPEFNLPAVDDSHYNSKDFAPASAYVVMFICNHCPYVQAIEDRLIDLGREYQGKPVQIYGICSNDAVNYPDDSFENLKKRWEEKEYSFPYLHDASQEVAKSFGAVCTPDFFVYNSEKKLAYRGRLDDSWKEPDKVTRRELKTAIDALLSSQDIPQEQNASMGCSIKWVS